MLIDVRHHLASLVAVFMALALGMLIGSSLLSDEGLVRHQRSLITALETRFDQLEAKSSHLNTRIASLEKENLIFREFGQEVLPRLIEGRLTGRRVAVVSLGSKDQNRPVAATVKRTLESAGAALVEEVIIPLDLTPELPSLSVRFLWDAPEPASPIGSGVQGASLLRLASGIARGLTKQVENGALPTASDAVIITAEPGALTNSNSKSNANSETRATDGGASITLGTGRLDGWQLALLLAQVLQQEKVFVAAVEPTGPAGRFGKLEKLLWVDNGDTPAGLLSLVVGIEMRQTGHYGVKEGARSLLPLAAGGE